MSGSGKPFDLVTIDTGEQENNHPVRFINVWSDEQSELAMKYGVRRMLSAFHMRHNFSPSRSGRFRRL